VEANGDGGSTIIGRGGDKITVGRLYGEVWLQIDEVDAPTLASVVLSPIEARLLARKIDSAAQSRRP
jgi:hypothetical protein